ncbi:SIMPL domain-containing protein [bacterium]|nr:SIMPL domain-containing protein [bacterium]MBT3730139.1 SIMPL domain-containing protein [bacterium]MBT4894780.1 SIMPL domain-containing protein [bacterium]
MHNETNSNHGCGFGGGRVKRMLVIVLLVLALFLIFKTLNTIKEYRFIGGGVSATNTINVSGEGEVFAVADIAEFSFSVVEQKDTVSEAQEIAAQRVNSILDFLEKSGVEETDIKTTNYNVYPRYEFEREACSGGFCPPGERVLKGFEVSQSISVKVRDTGDAGTVLSGIGELGASNISGLNFTIDDEDDLQESARKIAIEDAQAKAKQLAKDLDVKLVRVVNFSEFGSSPRFKTFAVAEMASLDNAGGGIPEIPVGENKITSNVSITYEIR